ncbi:MAG: hypothetical protein RDU20_16830 [Desulfomonilaceae bacterium]|nr:hypothetical protein [Desulfomonilaceae bacterium]
MPDRVGSPPGRVSGDSLYLASGSAFGILRSLLKILIMWEANEIERVAGGSPDNFAEQRRSFTTVSEDLRRHYGGF